MKTTEELFQESIEQYQELIDSATSLIAQMTSMSPDEILKKCEQLREMQTRQMEIDKFILEIMKDTGPAILDMPCTGEYQRQLDNAMDSCNKVAAKAHTIRTLLQKEMDKLKKGQLCLAGYNSSTQYSFKNIQGRY